MAALPLTIALVGAGLLGGGAVGYVAGARVRGRLRDFWTLNAVAALGCTALDIAALSTGRYALGYATIGLMGGLFTGLKYGYTDSLRSWPEPELADGAADDADDLAEDAEAPRDAGEPGTEQPLDDDGESAASTS